MKKTIGIVVLVVIIIVIINLISKSNDQTTTPTNDQTNTTININVPVTSSTTAPVTYTVTYTNTGFSPTITTVKAGDTVTFVNNSTGNMWVGSDPHPTHTDLSSFDELKSAQPGESWSYTFTKVGTWGYHNHRNPGMKGKVIVQ